MAARDKRDAPARARCGTAGNRLDAPDKIHRCARSEPLPKPLSCDPPTMWQWLHAASCGLALAGAATALGGLIAVQTLCTNSGGAVLFDYLTQVFLVRAASQPPAQGSCAQPRGRGQHGASTIRCSIRRLHSFRYLRLPGHACGCVRAPGSQPAARAAPCPTPHPIRSASGRLRAHPPCGRSPLHAANAPTARRRRPWPAGSAVAWHQRNERAADQDDSDHED